MKGVTRYQAEILSKLKGLESSTGKLVDLDQLLEQLSWSPSKESVQFTIRALIQKGYIEKMPVETRRGRNRVCYRLTEGGMKVLDPRSVILEDTAKAAEFLVPGISDLDEIEYEILES